MATEIGKLVVAFEAQAAQFDAAMRKADTNLKGVAAEAKKTEKAIKDAFIGPREDPLAKLKRDYAASSASLHRDLDKLKSKLTSTAGNGKQFAGLTSGLQGLRSAIASTNGPMAALDSQITSLVPVTASLTSGAGLLGVAIGAITIASVGAAAGIYSLTTSVAEATGKFIDLSQQTGFSVETLSALQNAAETSGGSIESVTGALFIFETKMGEAKDVTSEMGKLFKQLNIDTTNNEKALRQALTAIQGLTSAEDKATIGKKLFGRSVKDLLGAMKEAGSLDAYLNEQLRKGTLITTDAALRGDKLSDTVVEMGRAFQAARRIVADEFGPDVLRVVQAVTKLIEDNRPVIKQWAQDFRDVAHALDPLIAAVRTLDSALRGLAGIRITDVLGALLRYGSGAGLLFTGAQAIGRASQAPPSSGGPSLLDMTNALRGNRPKSLRGVNPFSITNPIIFPSGGGGGGGRGGGAAQIDAGQKLLERLEKQFKSLREQTELERVQDELLEKQYAKTTDTVKKKIQITAMDIDAQKKILAITRERIATGIEEREEFEKFVKLVQESSNIRERSAFDLTNKPFFDLGGGSVRFKDDASTRPRSVIREQTRPRIATEEEFKTRERLEEIRRRMTYLAEDMTRVWSNAIYDGFYGGAKRGLQSLTLGILDMIQQVILGRLKAALAEAFTGIGTSSGGKGGFWAGLGRSLLSGFLGGIGGGGGSGAIGGLGGGLGGIFGGGGGSVGGLGTVFAGAFASGGMIPSGQWGIVHDNERVYAGPQGAMVVPQSGNNGQAVNNYYINLPPDPKGRSYKSPESKRALAKQLVAALQGAQA